MAGKQLILINHLMEPPNKITGVTRFLFALLKELVSRSQYDYVLLTTWSFCYLPPALKRSSLRVITRPFVKSLPANLLVQMIKLPKVIKDLDATAEFNCNPIGCFFPSWPRVITVHDLYFESAPQNYRARHRLWWRWFFPPSLAAATRVICVSETTLDNLRRYHPEYAGKAQVVHLASGLIDVEDGISIEDLKIVKPYALYVGDNLPNKNPDVLAKALKILEAKGSPVQVYHVGTDGMGLLLRAMQYADLAFPVQTVRPLTDGELARVYLDARCLITTSVEEGFCLPIVEAQSLGTPVVCSDIPVFHEVAGNGALFFNPRDPFALADRIEQLIGDHELHLRLMNAGLQNSARYSWQRAAVKLEELFGLAISSLGGAIDN